MSTTKRSRSGSRGSKRSRVSSFKTPGTIVKVQWGDAWGSAGWASKAYLEREHKSLPVTSIGIVVKHDETGISLANGEDENGIYLGTGFVPQGMIKKVTKL